MHFLASWASRSASLLRSSSVIFLKPFPALMCMGVSPFLFEALTLALFSIRNFTMSRALNMHAMCKGVFLEWWVWASRTSLSFNCSSKPFTRANTVVWHARCNGVNPAESLVFTTVASHFIKYGMILQGKQSRQISEWKLKKKTTQLTHDIHSQQPSVEVFYHYNFSHHIWCHTSIQT